MSREELLKETEKGDSVYFNNDSYASARWPCGGAIEARKGGCRGRVKTLSCRKTTWPSCRASSCGWFLSLQQCCVAAKNILKNYPESVRRIMILDWNIHHGTGTQKVILSRRSGAICVITQI
ncbi:BBT_HP_G0131730.mRNA.1.CDS.1 [Saccharomyces cerevisiae]|nr:BBT_HP_G0131730.mRNA.1.CDS.1 [Saccharomyces cerevisiae]CAI6975402.1 BBT_HP_G0131730.mRNA.1.CDS.1 [Saccharomyces cerevisiae]